jgi:hypothetical protein
MNVFENFIESDFMNVVHGYDKNFDVIQTPKPVDTSRWAVWTVAVVQHKETGVFYKLTWDEPATEYQDGQDKNFNFREVKPVEKIVIVYE